MKTIRIRTCFFSVGKKIQLDLRDMDYISWQRDIKTDLETLSLLIGMSERYYSEYDYKLNQLIRVIPRKGSGSH